MLENYFKIAWRNLLRNRISSIINISDLAVGMGVALWWVFALWGGMALVVTLVTVSFQAVRAAVMSPVKSLRSE